MFFRKITKFISKILIKSLPLGIYDPDFDSRCCSKQFKLTYFSNLSGKHKLFNYHQHFTPKKCVFLCVFMKKCLICDPELKIGNSITIKRQNMYPWLVFLYLRPLLELCLDLYRFSMNLRWYTLEMLFGNSCHLRNGSFDLHKVGAYFLKVMHYSFQDKKSADQDLSNAFFGFLISRSIAE